MKKKTLRWNRREFIERGAAATVAFGVANSFLSAAESSLKNSPICAFEKFVQDLSYAELADVIAELGFDGIEATVRKGGHVLPERVEDDLPMLNEALQKNGLRITTMATDVRGIDDPQSAAVIRTAANLGIKFYRLGFLHYDKDQPILIQLDRLRPQLEKLATLNQEVGIGALFQNHAGAQYVGGTIWDLRSLIKDIPPEQIGCVFDIRHATVEAGLSWPVLYKLIKPHISAVSVKDFRWDGRQVVDVPLGEGNIDPQFFQMLKHDSFAGPISIHVEYLESEGTQQNIEALRHDLSVLREWRA